jgi:spore germination protein GerM
MNKKLWGLLVILFLIAGVAGGYFLWRNFSITARQPGVPHGLGDAAGKQEMPGDYSVLQIYYPVGERLEILEKRVQRRTKQSAIAEAVLEEFFKGPGSGKVAHIPGNVISLGIYKDQAQTLHVDLSDELRRDFHGDAQAEFLLLKGIYESLISNLQDVQDVKVLVEGKEIETLGGHFYLKYPLKNTVSYGYGLEGKSSDE